MSEREAYKAMLVFLERLQRSTNSGDLAEFLGGMSLLPDGQPADPAYWQEWLESVQQAQEAQTGNVITVIRGGL